MATLPTEAVKHAASLLPPGRALDIACGAGRHALWLHQQGWTVTAVDRDAQAIETLRIEAPGINARILDLEREPLPTPDTPYDLILCWLYFQPDLYPTIATLVRPGGIVALSALRQGRFAAQPRELEGYFPGWPVLHRAETERAFELLLSHP